MTTYNLNLPMLTWAGYQRGARPNHFRTIALAVCAGLLLAALAI